MIARIWRGVVPRAKAEAYAEYLARSERGVADYRRIPGNRGAFLLRKEEGEHVRFLLISMWESRAAITAYAGPDSEKARYFEFDRECLIDPEPGVEHYEVLASEPGST